LPLVAGSALAASAPTSTAFDDAKFTFKFEYEPSWIPSIQPEGESITFALSEGEVFISASRDPNPKHLKTRADLADDQIASWKRREGLVFSKLERVESTLGGVAATRIEGTAREFDEEIPYRLEQYIVEREGHLYVVKYSGLYDSSLPYWDDFQKLLRSFRFRNGPPVANLPPPSSFRPPPATPRQTSGSSGAEPD
jgi:hypothetical protein